MSEGPTKGGSHRKQWALARKSCLQVGERESEREMNASPIDPPAGLQRSCGSTTAAIRRGAFGSLTSTVAKHGEDLASIGSLVSLQTKGRMVSNSSIHGAEKPCLS